MSNELKALALVSGHFVMTVSGGRRGTMVLAEFDNIITNSGLNDIFASTSGSGASRCQLGTGTAVPAATDNALQIPGPVTTTSSRLWSTSPSYVAGPPDYTSDFTTMRFAVGAATGTWTEVAMSRNSPTTFFSRALILDGGGAPTSITVLADEQLDVTYTGRVYPPTADVTGTVNLGLSTHDFIIRPSQVNGPAWGPNRVFGLSNYAGASGTPNILAYDGAAGPRTGSPSGTIGYNGTYTYTASAYVSNSYQRQFEVRLDLAQGNVAGGGIRSLVFTPNSGGGGGLQYQVEFTPKINKDATRVLRLNFTAGFARRP